MTTAAEKQTMTAEQFNQGKTWEQYAASISANKERFQQLYDSFTPKAEEVAFLKEFAARKGLQVVAIGEDWCPDVVRGIPCIAKACNAAGVQLRIFERDQHMDLTNEFLWRHKFMSIPVVVFYDKEFNELGHFTERPATAYKFTADLRAKLIADGTKEEELMAAMRPMREAVQAEWMDDTLKEIREQILYRVM